MAIVADEGALARTRSLASPHTVAALRLFVWVAAAVVPWTAIALAVKAIVAG